MKKWIVLAILVTMAVGVYTFAEPQASRHRGPASADFKQGHSDRMHGMFRRFFESPELIEKLGLTDEQVETLSQVRFESQKSSIALQSEVAQAQLEVRRLLSQDEPDETEVMGAIDKAGQTAVALRKSQVQHMLKGRAILGSDTWKTMKQMIGERRHHFRPSRRGHRRDHGPEMGPWHRRGGSENRPKHRSEHGPESRSWHHGPHGPDSEVEG